MPPVLARCIKLLRNQTETSYKKKNFDSSQIITLVLFIVIAIITIIGVVIITEGQRNVPVSYAKRVRGMKMYGGVNTHLPLRVNMAGVIPIIVAISIVAGAGIYFLAALMFRIKEASRFFKILAGK